MTRRQLTYRELELCEICSARPSTATNVHELTGMAVSQACVTLGKLASIGVLDSFKRGTERLFFPTEAGTRKIKRSTPYWLEKAYKPRRHMR